MINAINLPAFFVSGLAVVLPANPALSGDCLYYTILLMNPSSQPEKVHYGRNIKRFRDMLGIKQERLAFELGADWSQKRISLLEKRAFIEAEVLEQIALVLKIPVEAIRKFDEETALLNLQTNFNEIAPGKPPVMSEGFDPLMKWVKAIEENERLYERLLRSEREKVELLRKVLEK